MSVPPLDTARLGPYLKSAVPGFGTLQSAEKFAGGQSNPTYRLTTDTGAYVLRRKPPGQLLKSAHAVDREFRVQQALAGTGVPVARVHHLCRDEDVIGSMFYVMDYVEGRVFWDPSLPDLDTARRAEVYDQLNAVLAAIHSVDLEAAGLTDYGPPGNYYARQYSTWTKQYRAAETGTVPEMEELMRWLGDNMPADDGRVSLVHGDYRIDNVMFAADAPRAVAVMDWELSTLGHPFADLAYQCMLWRWPRHPGLSGLGDEDVAGLGIPSEEAYVARYCARTGISEPENWPFYIAFGFFRLAAIVQGVRKRAIDGTASSERARQIGDMAEPLARSGLAALRDA